MNLLLDTDTLVEILRGQAQATAALAAVSTRTEIHVSAISAAELYHGAARSNQVSRNTYDVQLLLAGLSVIDVDEAIAERFGVLKASLQAAGQVVADFDLLIAATALEHNLTLVTHNTRHFARIPGLALDDWIP